jgi:microcin C transport system permease protein
MADHSSKSNLIPRDDLPREEIPERDEMRGPLDVPQEERGEDIPTLADRMLARQSIPIRHNLPDIDQNPRRADGTDVTGEAGDTAPLATKPLSIMQKRWRRFKSLKRGYYSFIILVTLYLVSFLLPILINNMAIVVSYKGDLYFPAVLDALPGVNSFYPGTTFGQADNPGPAKYRELDEQLEAANGGDWALMPLYTWGPLESDFTVEGQHPMPPSGRHIMGTDEQGRDVFARMCYGFNISISFALLLALVNYTIGATLGGLMGFYGGKFDLFSQRVVEIWSNIPFLYTVIIISSILIPNFTILVFVLSLFGWIGISYYMRGEFLREKGRDYVAAAIALGARDRQIIFKHILPNSLTPLISFLPFSIVGGISSLVSLDYLGFGLPAPTPSWGQMVHVGLATQKVWLVVAPLSAMFSTLLIVTFIGEAIREAFDPRVFSRLR